MEAIYFIGVTGHEKSRERRGSKVIWLFFLPIFSPRAIIDCFGGGGGCGGGGSLLLQTIMMCSFGPAHNSCGPRWGSFLTAWVGTGRGIRRFLVSDATNF